MKKKMKRKLMSLALCSMAVSVFAGIAFSQENTTASAAAEATYSTVSGWKIEETAAVRNTDPNGIRFTTTLSEAKNENYTYGTLLIPADMLGAEELTHATEGVKVIETKTWQDADTYTAALVGKDNGDGTFENLPESYYNRPFVARSYAYDAANNTYYYTENTAVRSIGYVAYMAKQAGKSTELIDTIVSKTQIELVFNENISVYNDVTDGLSLIYNVVSNVSDKVAALKIGGIIDLTGVGSISYTSTNEDVISVNGETLTSVGDGKSTITATCTINGVEYTATKTLFTNTFAAESEYSILVSSSASDYETEAAQLLQKIVKEATGVNLEIVTETGSESTASKYISIGETTLAKNNVDISDLTKETASRVKTVKNMVFVRGVNDLATLYGVQELLGDCVGYEHFMENSYTVNKKEEFTIVDKDYIPAIEFEVMQYLLQDADVVDEYAMRDFTDGMIPLGGNYLHNSTNVISDGMDDSTDYYISNKAYKEWYATTTNLGFTIYHKDGSRNKLELCYTAHGNSTQRTTMVERVATAMYDAMTAKEYKTYNRIGFSQMDHVSWCECDYCENEGNPSDNILHFVLDVTANLKAKLQAAGDTRADTFRIATLFYHATNPAPKNAANYATNEYMQHIEMWFAETGVDYVDAIDNTDGTNNWNESVYASLQSFASIASEYGAKLLWWNYFVNSTNFFIPYDSFDAIRGNYQVAADLGVDYMLGQTMGTRLNWTRLKQYLMSELHWNANQDISDDQWNAWIDAYMVGAFGVGAKEMRNYFNAWNTWTDANATTFRRTDSYDEKSENSASINVDARNSNLMSQDTLQLWIDYCDKAIAALDENDSNYIQQYNNILLEKLTPLYLMMYIYGEYDNGSFSNTANVIPYAADFLKGVNAWFVETEGEGVDISTFKTAVANAASNTATDAEKKIAVIGGNLTLENEKLTAGTYTVMVKSLSASESAQTTSVTVSTAGTATVALSGLNLTAGNAYSFTLTASSVNVMFGNVFAISGYVTTADEMVAVSDAANGYYIITQNIDCAQTTLGTAFSGTVDGDGYTVSYATEEFLPNATVLNLTVSTPSSVIAVEDRTFILGGQSDLWLYNDLFVKGHTYTATANGTIVSSAVFKEGQFKASIGTAAEVGQIYAITVEDETDGVTYSFDVMGITKYITTLEELTALAVSGTESQSGDYYIYGYYVLGNDIDCGGALIKAGYNYGWSRFAGTLDGNGHTISNFVAGEGGIFGGLWYATIKDLNIENASISTMSADNGWNYGAVFANVATDTIFENITVQLNSIDWDTTNSAIMTGVFVSHNSNSQGGEGMLYKNVTADLTSCSKIPAIFGMQVTSLNCENVTVYVANAMGDSVVYAYSDENVTKMNKPDGVTLRVLPEILLTKDGGAVLPNYNGDVADLGFAEGSYVFKATSSDAWNDRTLINVDSSMDYVSVEFVLPNAFTDNNCHAFIVYTWKDGTIVKECRIYGGGGYIAGYETNVVIEDAAGNDVTTTTLSANTLYVMKIYYEGAARVDIATGAVGATIYYANVGYGETAIPLPENVVIYGETSATLSQYADDQTTLGFAEDTYVFEWNTSSTWTDRIRINADATKNYVSFDFVLSSAFTGNTSFSVWTATEYTMSAQYNILTAGGYTYSDRIVLMIQDANGNDITRTALSANTMYKMTVYLYDGHTNVQVGAGSAMTIYIANVETGTVAEGLSTNVITQSDSNYVLPKYTGDEKALGFAGGTYVQYYAVGDTIDFWGTRALFTKDGASDYVSFDFVLSTEFTAGEALIVWATTPSGLSVVGRVLGAGGYSVAATGFEVMIQDVNGNDVTSSKLSANTWYRMKLYFPEATLLHVGINQANITMYMANVESGNGPDVTIGMENSSGVVVEQAQYMGDETALGFADGTYVYKMTTGSVSSAWDNRAIIAADSTQNYVSVDFVLSQSFAAYHAITFWVYKDSLTVAGRILGASGYEEADTNFNVEIYDANGNDVTSQLLSANTVYTIKIYSNGGTQVQLGFADVNMTVYMANAKYSNE